MRTWIPVLALALGLASGEALAAYAGWIVRVRRGDPHESLSTGASAASLVNGLGWLLAVELSPTAAQAAELALTCSMAVVFTIVDVRIRLIPNELVAALLCLTATMCWFENGFAGYLGRLAGFLTALTLFLIAMLIAGPGKVGGGDVKLAAAVGFAAGFPNVLVAILAMALLASLTGGVRIGLKKMGKAAPMPFAGFLAGGLALTMFLDRAGALRFIK